MEGAQRDVGFRREEVDNVREALFTIPHILEPISKLFGPSLPLQIGFARRTARGMRVPCSSAATQQTRFSGDNPKGWRLISHVSALLVAYLANALPRFSRFELYEMGRQRGPK